MKEIIEDLLNSVTDATNMDDGTVSLPILSHFFEGVLNEHLETLRRLRVAHDEAMEEDYVPYDSIVKEYAGCSCDDIERKILMEIDKLIKL